MSRRAVIQAVGHSVPEKVLTNAELEAIVDTDNEWIVQRTGIQERRICTADETASTLGAKAGIETLHRAGMNPADLEMIICGCVTGDMMFPSTSCLIQDAMGAKNAGAFDVGAACAGFIHGICIGASMIESGQCENALVIGVDVLTKFMDWTDRSTCVLFGDGAGAVLLQAAENSERGVLKTVLMADGSGSQHIDMEFGGSLYPAQDPRSEGKRNTIFMAGREVYRFAVNAMGDACCKVLDKAGLTTDDVDLFVPHQANLRIIESAAGRLSLPESKVFSNVQKYGNTSAGSIPLGLYEAEQQGRLKQGMIVLTVGFGAGLVWGANVIRW